MNSLDKMEDYDRLKQERDELAAQVKVKDAALRTCVIIPGPYGEQMFNGPLVRRALSLTPSEALREVKASVLDEMAGGWDETRTFSAEVIERTIRAEAASIRKGRIEDEQRR